MASTAATSSSSTGSQKIAVCGLGGRLRVELVRELIKCNLFKDGNVQIVALCDNVSEAIDRFVKQYPQFADVPRYTSYDEMLANAKTIGFTWVMIASTNNVHYEQICKAMDAGLHVWTEKPVAIKEEHLHGIEEKARKNNVNVVVGYVLRHAPFYQKIAEMVKRIGKIGSVYMNETTSPWHGFFIFGDWRRFEEIGGPMLLEKCCHDMDMFLRVTGLIPIRVSSFGANNFFTQRNAFLFEKNPELFCSGLLNDKSVNAFTSKKTAYDTQTVMMRCSNGALATFSFCALSHDKSRVMEIYGAYGTIKADLIKGTIEVSSHCDYTEHNDGIVESVTMGRQNCHGNADGYNMNNLCKVVVESGEDDHENYDDSRGAVVSALLSLAADRSAKIDGVPVNCDWWTPEELAAAEVFEKDNIGWIVEYVEKADAEHMDTLTKICSKFPITASDSDKLNRYTSVSEMVSCINAATTAAASEAAAAAKFYARLAGGV